MKIMTSRQGVSREVRWEKSRKAEGRGDYAKAFKIHQTILIEDEMSYAATLRAGWLCYRQGDYEKAQRFYEQASALGSDDWPLHGIMNCLEALGDTDALAKVAKSVYGTGKMRTRSAA